MASPFPGMDPYIEECELWGDFHSHLIALIKSTLAEHLPQRYVVRGDYRTYNAVYRTREEVPDPHLIPCWSARDRNPIAMTAVIVDEHREPFVNIIEVGPEKRIVTRIEVLRPANKRKNSASWELYTRTWEDLLLARVNLVEIDLLRGGERMPMLDAWPDCPYTLLVARAHRADHCQVWKGDFRTRLPIIPVPLSSPDADLALDLQPLIEAIYQVSRYAQSIDYTRPLTLPLKDEDAAWLADRLTQPRKKP